MVSVLAGDGSSRWIEVEPARSRVLALVGGPVVKPAPCVDVTLWRSWAVWIYQRVGGGRRDPGASGVPLSEVSAFRPGPGAPGNPWNEVWSGMTGPAG
jgi:hypothetical protein